jgi:hypothetical protein
MQNLRGRVAPFSASPLLAGRLLLAEADRVEGVDAALAAQMRVEAAAAIGLAGRVQEDLTVAIDAHRTAVALGDDDPSARSGLLLGMARILAGDPQSDRPLFEASLARLAGQPLSADSALDLSFYLCAAAQALSWIGELDRAANLIAEFRVRTRDALLPGLLSLSHVLGISSEIELRRGRLAAAHAAAAESVQLAADTSAGTQYAFADAGGGGEVGDADRAGGLDGEQQAQPGGVGEQREPPCPGGDLGGVAEAFDGVADLLRVDDPVPGAFGGKQVHADSLPEEPLHI